MSSYRERVTLECQQFMTRKSMLLSGKVSILGDSISTFKGTMLEGYVTYYPARDVTSVEDMWWHKLLSSSGSILEVNASWSGSCVTDARSRWGFPDFYDRTPLLGSPDYIFVALGTNDCSEGVALGAYEYDRPTAELSESAFIPAYIKGVKSLKTHYPCASIFLLVFNMADKYAEAIKNIGEHFHLPTIDARSYYVDNNHPDKNGMDIIFRSIAVH